jgi:hypothetical protein
LICPAGFFSFFIRGQKNFSAARGSFYLLRRTFVILGCCAEIFFLFREQKKPFRCAGLFRKFYLAPLSSLPNPAS